MCKIFVGDKPIILTTKVEQETNFKNYFDEIVKEVKKEKL